MPAAATAPAAPAAVSEDLHVPLVPSSSSSLSSSTVSRSFSVRSKLVSMVPSGIIMIARSPGRVNLIGEHIDYEGYDVLPMAVSLDTIVACGAASPEDASDSGITYANLDDLKYPQGVFTSLEASQPMPRQHTWGSYILAAYKGVHALLQECAITFTPKPLVLVVSGTVPQGSGLSSSSALCCACMLAMAATLVGDTSKLPSKTKFADAACKAERHVGVMSGGMDQTVSLCAKKNFASLVTFVPSISTKDVPLPEDAVFIVGNSLAVSNKALTNASKYNLRVVECRLAALVIARKIGIATTMEEMAKISTLRDVEAKLVCHSANSEDGAAGDGVGVVAPLNDHDDEELQHDDYHCPAAIAARELLHAQPYTQQELEEFLGASLADIFDNKEAALITFEPAATLNKGFKLLQRTLHVYREKSRVHRMAAACADAASLESPAKRAKASSGAASSALQPIGTLMSSSHESCARLFECSCPELDRLVEVMTDAGALGARLTGAGWGGCAVGLFARENVQDALKQIRKEYYLPKFEQAKASSPSIDEEAWFSERCFVTAPCAGAAFVNLP